MIGYVKYIKHNNNYNNHNDNIRSTNLSYGYLFDPDKQEKIYLEITDPFTIEQLYILHSKYPQITKVDSDNTQTILSNHCIDSISTAPQTSFEKTTACNVATSMIVSMYIQQLGVQLK